MSRLENRSDGLFGVFEVCINRHVEGRSDRGDTAVQHSLPTQLVEGVP